MVSTYYYELCYMLEPTITSHLYTIRGYNIIKNNIPGVYKFYIVWNNISLRHKEFMLNTWQKLVLNQQFSVYREHQNLVLHHIIPNVTFSSQV